MKPGFEGVRRDCGGDVQLLNLKQNRGKWAGQIKVGGQRMFHVLNIAVLEGLAVVRTRDGQPQSQNLDVFANSPRFNGNTALPVERRTVDGVHGPVMFFHAKHSRRRVEQRGFQPRPEHRRQIHLRRGGMTKHGRRVHLPRRGVASISLRTGGKFCSPKGAAQAIVRTVII